MRTKTPLQAEKILSVAARLFATHRYHAARMEDIAAAAGVGKGTLYRYFKDKEELYLALLSRASDGWSAILSSDTINKGDPRSRLEAVVTALLDFFEGNPHLFDLIQHAEAFNPPDKEFPWQQSREETIALVQHIFDQGCEDGLFAVSDTRLASLLLLGSLRAVIRFGERPRPADMVPRIVDMFLFGALAPEKGRVGRSGRLATMQTA